MPTDALISTLVLVGALALFVSDRLRVDVVALLALVVLVVAGVLPVADALAGFSNPAVVMIAALFVVGAGISESGVAEWLGRRLEHLAGHGERRLIVTVMLGTSLLSAFMSSTGTVAMLMPIVGSLARRRGVAPSQLLMPMAFAAHLGSNLTLVATPPNLVVNDALRAAGHEPFRFFSFTPAGLAILAVGVAWMALAGRRLLGARAEELPSSRAVAPSIESLAVDYGLADALQTIRVPPGAPLVGQSLGTANLRARFDVTVVGIQRSEPAGAAALRVVPGTVFAADDLLRVIGAEAAVSAMIAALGLEPARPAAFALPPEESLAEVVLPRRSRLVGRTLRDAKFRDRHRATVLAVRRGGAGGLLVQGSPSLRDLELSAGDILLLKGRRRYLRNLRDASSDLILLAEVDAGAEPIDVRSSAGAAIAITLGMIVIMALGVLPSVVAVLLAALAMVLAGCVRPAEVYRSVSWESVVLIAGMMPLAAALEQSGAIDHAVALVEPHLAAAGPLVALALLVVATSALGMVLSNTTTAVLLAPVAVRLASALGVAPEPLLVGVAFAASAAYATPIASPVNMLVMGPAGYRFGDFVRVGLPLQILVLVTAVVVVPPFFGF